MSLVSSEGCVVAIAIDRGRAIELGVVEGVKGLGSVGQNAWLSRRRLRIRVPSLPPFFCCEDFGEVQTVSGIRIRCHACPKSSSRS
jgi:hypothetical protein